jgi:AcrR family transcriptional regulator
MVNTGRPRDSAIDDAILDEAARMVVEHGYGGTTIDAVARAAGTTRPAVYRRYASLAQIVSAAVSARVGFDPVLDSGDLRTDLRRIQEAQVAFFTDPLVVRALPGLIEESSRNPALGTGLVEDVMSPRRQAVAGAIELAAGRGEIEVGHDVERITDLLVGPLLLRTLLPGSGPVDEGLVDSTVAAALHAVRHHGSVVTRDAGIASAD